MDKETRAAFTQMAELVAQMADELVPLVQATQQHLGQLGGVLVLPTVEERVSSLQTNVFALRQAFGLLQPSLDHAELP